MSDLTIWAVIAGLAGMTFMIRYSFLGLLSGRVLPGWASLALTFVPVTVLPALVAPMLFLAPEGGWASLPALLAGAATLTVGMLARSLIGAFLTGVVVFHMAQLAGW